MGTKRSLFTVYFVVYAVSAAVYYQLAHGVSKPFEVEPAYTAASFAIGPGFLAVVSVDRYLWRFRLARVLLGIPTPNISGRWAGYIHSTFTDHKVKHPVILEIWQTLSSVSVWYYDENAITHSLIANFVQPNTGGPVRLYVLYQNQPITTKYKTLHTHNGVMDLAVDQSSRRITGTYFNNPHQRKTYGEMRLEFETRKCRGEFGIDNSQPNPAAISGN